MNTRAFLKQSQRIVIKAGTSILTGPDGRLCAKNIQRLGDNLRALVKDKKQVVLVSSGAIAFGMQAMDIRKRPKEMPRLQACAAIGQNKLMHAYEELFSRAGVTPAQILLTRDGLESRPRFLAARRTFNELFRMGVLPIVNENDTVATEEIAFGDNDILSIQVAHLVHADLLVILSDVDGFYLKDGSRLRAVSSEHEIDSELVKHLKDTRKEKTVGGMRAKLRAARMAMRLGIPLMIVNGHAEGIIEKAVAGDDVGTIFLADKSKKNARKKWIAFSASRAGAMIVDRGAYDALRAEKRSLLPSGVIKVRGDFNRGEVVELETTDGKIFGRGVVRYTHREVEKIAGKKTNEIQKLLGYRSPGEIIHRDDLVTWG